MRVVYHPLFAFDLEEAFFYYERQEPGIQLGKRFIDEADKAVTIIEEHPLPGGVHSSPEKYPPRAAENFSLSIHYRVITADEIQVLGIYHGARNPRIWQQRW